MVGFYNYTVWMTYASLVSGGIGIYFSLSGHPLIAIICLLLSGFLDMFDGKIARTKKNRTDMEKQFGIQIDSLTDLVCFGVLPCCIGYAVGMQNRFFMIIFAIFILFGMIRLAYYNVLEANRQEKNIDKMGFIGVPITMSSILFPLLYCFKPLLSSYFFIAYAVIMGILGISYVVRIRLPKPNIKQSIVIGAICLVVMITVLIIEHFVIV